MTAFQISDISTSADGRIWILGRVLAGVIKAGDNLAAVGLSETVCTIDEVAVGGVSRPAEAGEDPYLYARKTGHEALLEAGSKTYFALVTRGSVKPATQFAAELRWTSVDEKSRGIAPAVPVIAEDSPVTLRFGGVEVRATLKRKDKVMPLGPVETWEFILEKPLPIVLGYPFHVEFRGDSLATGRIVNPGGR